MDRLIVVVLQEVCRVGVCGESSFLEHVEQVQIWRCSLLRDTDSSLVGSVLRNKKNIEQRYIIVCECQSVGVKCSKLHFHGVQPLFTSLLLMAAVTDSWSIFFTAVHDECVLYVSVSGIS